MAIEKSFSSENLLKSLNKYLKNNLESTEGLIVIYDRIQQKQKMIDNDEFILYDIQSNDGENGAKQILMIGVLSRKRDGDITLSQVFDKVKAYFNPTLAIDLEDFAGGTGVFGAMGIIDVSEGPFLDDGDTENLRSRSLICTLAYGQKTY